MTGSLTCVSQKYVDEWKAHRLIENSHPRQLNHRELALA